MNAVENFQLLAEGRFALILCTHNLTDDRDTIREQQRVAYHDEDLYHLLDVILR